MSSETNKEFFLVALPGLEDLVKAEVADWFPAFETKVEYGGVTVNAPLAQGLAMNLVLKTPTRILLRVASFTCRDFPKLFNKVSGLKWREWIDPSCELEVHASTSRSRLKIKKRIEGTCLEAWKKQQKNLKTSHVNKASLYVRFLDNLCTLSLDTSGERLHKRGSRQLVGTAPLRETIAGALIQLMGRKIGASDTRPVELIDPMMGSGTFLIEALFRDRLVEKRDFAFEVFADQPGELPKLQASRHKIESLIGFEQDEKTLTAAKENLRTIENDCEIKLRAEDFFKAEKLPASPNRQRWVLVNPPYGERLKVKEPLGEFYARLFATTDKVADPDLACFILPLKAVHGKFDLPHHWKAIEKRRFSNGGIPVIAFIFARN